VRFFWTKDFEKKCFVLYLIFEDCFLFYTDKLCFIKKQNSYFEIIFLIYLACIIFFYFILFTQFHMFLFLLSFIDFNKQIQLTQTGKYLILRDQILLFHF